MARVSAERTPRGVLPTLAVTLAAAAAVTAWIAAGPRPGGGAACEGPERWRSLIEAHLERYPEMEIADGYKLLHQAVLGSEHAVTSRAAAAGWLSEELLDLGDGPEEPLVDPLGGPPGVGAEAAIARIHLRPFQARGGAPPRLADAFFETASRVPADQAGLECALTALTAPIGLDARSWGPDEAAAYVSARRAEGFPAVHHSEAYREAYYPAYRVVAVELVPDAIAGARP